MVLEGIRKELGVDVRNIGERIVGEKYWLVVGLGVSPREGLGGCTPRPERMVVSRSRDPVRKSGFDGEENEFTCRFVPDAHAGGHVL